MPKLKNTLIAGVLYISIIAILYGFTLTMYKTESDTFIPGDVEMQEMGSYESDRVTYGGSTRSSPALNAKGASLGTTADFNADVETINFVSVGGVSTLPGATHTTGATRYDFALM